MVDECLPGSGIKELGSSTFGRVFAPPHQWVIDFRRSSTDECYWKTQSNARSRAVEYILARFYKYTRIFACFEHILSTTWQPNVTAAYSSF